jgi:hypothetical protein
MVQGRNSNNFQNANSSSTTNQLGHNLVNNYQPCCRLRRTSQPKLIIYDCCKKEGHLKHECEIPMMIDCMDLKFRFQEKKNQMHGQVNAVDETLVF